MVRLILKCKNGSEFAIYEAYPLIVDTNKFHLNRGAIETSVLHNVNPYSIKIQIVNATLKLKSLQISKKRSRLKQAKIHTERQRIIKQKNTKRLKHISNYIQRNNLKWVAGETEIANMSYSKKKEIFGREKYRTFGLEYYKGGIFTFPDIDRNETNTTSDKLSSSNNNERNYEPYDDSLVDH